MWATYPRSASSGYPSEFHVGCYQKQTSSSDISVYHADFHEGHGTVEEWQGRGMACANSRVRGTAWERHGTCELAFIVSKLRNKCGGKHDV
jgi:hypothetical protein